MDGMKGVAIRWEWLRAVVRIEARDVDVVLSRYVAEQLPDFDLCLGGTLSRDLFVVSLLDDVGCIRAWSSLKALCLRGRDTHTARR